MLGSGGMTPVPERLLVSLAVKLNGRIYVFDAGEGTQLAWKKARLGLRGLRLVALTHLHADHCLGLPGLLMMRSQMENPEPVVILGPPGTGEFIETVVRILRLTITFPLEIREWSRMRRGTAYADEQVRILWRPLKHTRFCLGYRLEERPQPGRFHKDRAEKLGVPQGPLWGCLQRGEPVRLESGQEVRPDQVLGPPRLGRSLAYVVDTRPSRSALELCRKVDLAFIEGMFLPEHAHHARLKGHMTVAEAARIAAAADVGRVVIVHISPRYDEAGLGLLEAEGRKTFHNLQVGRDLDTFRGTRHKP